MNPSHRIEEMKEVIERYKQRVEAAEAEAEDTDKTMRAYSDQLVKVTAELVAAQAQLAELAKQEPVLYALRFKNMDGSPERLINDNCLFRHREDAEKYGLGGNYVKQESGKIEWVPNPALNPEVIPLFTRAAPAAAPVDLFAECKWTYDESDYFWSSACGEDWQFTDGGPKENRVKFCQGCGGVVRLIEGLK